MELPGRRGTYIGEQHNLLQGFWGSAVGCLGLVLNEDVGLVFDDGTEHGGWVVGAGGAAVDGGCDLDLVTLVEMGL